MTGSSACLTGRRSARRSGLRRSGLREKRLARISATMHRTGRQLGGGARAGKASFPPHARESVAAQGDREPATRPSALGRPVGEAARPFAGVASLRAFRAGD